MFMELTHNCRCSVTLTLGHAVNRNAKYNLRPGCTLQAMDHFQQSDKNMAPAEAAARRVTLKRHFEPSTLSQKST